MQGIYQIEVQRPDKTRCDTSVGARNIERRLTNGH